MKTRIASFAAALTLGATLLVTASGPVAAVGTATDGPAGKGVCAAQATAARVTGASVDALRAFGDCEINRRLTTLSALATRVSGSKVLTTGDASALSSEISSTVSGLNSLKATIDAETSATALRADIAKIATQFRVYVLVVPQVNLVNAADGVLASQARFADVNTRLSARIAKAQAAGKDVSAAQTSLDAMNAKVSAAVALATGLSAKLLPLTPADYNGGTAAPILNSARSSLGTARNDLKQAVASAQACRVALKALGF